MKKRGGKRSGGDSNINEFLWKAARAWSGATLNIQKFDDAYRHAISRFGDEAIRRFRASYPMFGDREWRRIGAIADGRLLPHFMFKSDAFVVKLLNMPDSKRIQRVLVGASTDGKLRVDRGNGPERVSLSELTKKEERALVMLLSEENEELSEDELVTKFKGLVRAVNKSGAKRGRGIRRLANELVDAIVELESLRDDEWDFEETYGLRYLWTDEVCEAHDALLSEIQNARDRVQKLCREIKNDEKLEV